MSGDSFGLEKHNEFSNVCHLWMEGHGNFEHLVEGDSIEMWEFAEDVVLGPAEQLGELDLPAVPFLLR